MLYFYGHPNKELFFKDTILCISILFEFLHQSSQSENADTYNK